MHCRAQGILGVPAVCGLDIGVFFRYELFFHYVELSREEGKRPILADCLKL